MANRKQSQQSLHLFFGGKRPNTDTEEVSDEQPRPSQQKKTRKFQPSWKAKYKWLEFDENENKMFCAYCREFQNTLRIVEI